MRESYFSYTPPENHLCTVSAFPLTQDENGNKLLLITGIQTSRNGRNKGLARKLLNEVIKDADRENVTLMLSVDPDPDVDRARLVNWYLRVGFRFVDDSETTMRRYPDKQYMLEPNTGFKLKEHLELWHNLNTQLYNVRELKAKHQKQHAESSEFAHTHKKPTRQKDAH